MRYIGGKSTLLNDIETFVVNRTNNVTKIIDIFSGSGVVSAHFKSLGYNVIGNDFLYFAYVLSRGSTALNSTPNFAKLNIESPINYLNALTLKTADVDIKDCFIFQNYSEKVAEENTTTYNGMRTLQSLQSINSFSH